MPSALIVGCGVFGLSTALELVQNGYQVTAMDAYLVPSPWSAANDFNKIIRAEYLNVAYVKLAIEAIEQWRSDPKFRSAYNECGRLLLTPISQKGRREFEEIGMRNIRNLGGGQGIETIVGGASLASRFPSLKDNNVDESADVRWNPESGLAHAAHSLEAVFAHASKLGAKFLFGECGHALGLETISSQTYVVTKDGQKHTADIIIISAGASTGRLLDLKNLQSATGLFVTHIQLSDEEYARYEKIPIVFDSEIGYFFPPDPETQVLKICLSGTGASNFVADPFNLAEQRSLPRYKVQNPQDTIPLSGPEQARKLLLKYAPDLAGHSFLNHKVCWIADTADSNFIIDKVANYENLYVATGDSGHAFKFLPNIGKYVRQKIEKSIDPELEHIWRWKEDAKDFNAANCPWRVLKKTLNFKDIEFVKE